MRECTKHNPGIGTLRVGLIRPSRGPNTASWTISPIPHISWEAGKGVAFTLKHVSKRFQHKPPGNALQKQCLLALINT